MVTTTAGRLLDPSPSTTSSGTSMPVAVLPPRRTVLRNLTRGSMPADPPMSPGRRLGRLDEPHLEEVGELDTGAVLGVAPEAALGGVAVPVRRVPRPKQVEERPVPQLDPQRLQRH